MKKFLIITTALVAIAAFALIASAQNEAAPPIWQVTRFDVSVNVQSSNRSLNNTITINAVNVGGSPGRTFTVRMNPKASVKSASLAGAATSFRIGAEPRGDLQKIEVSLPSSVAPSQAVSVTLNYILPVESNTGLASISPVATQFLPLSFWYPMPNTPYTSRGADTAPYRLTINAPGFISSGVESGQGGSSFDQTLSGQPFFVQGDWDRIEGTGDAKGITAFLAKGASATEKKQAEALISFGRATRAFYTSIFGPAPNVPVRFISVRRGAGFNDTGTVLVDDAAFRRQKLDAITALSIAEALARLWIGGQTPVRGEGGGVLHDGLVRFVAILALEKQFGRDAAEAELLRNRIAFTSVARRDGPLSRANQFDSTYFSSVPNRGSMVWRLADRLMGHDAFMSIVSSSLEAGKASVSGLTLASFRAALVERGGEAIKTLLDQQLDQVVDTDLLVGLPQQRGADWVSALRNLGSIDVNVKVVATTDRGEQLSVAATIPARNFSEAVFKTTSRIVRVEVDPDKLYPQVDYSNDVMPRVRELSDAIAAATLQLGAQDFVKAEAQAREILSTAPRFQEARIVLARALLGAGKIDEAEKAFRSLLDEVLPTPVAFAWGNLGLGEISLKRGQNADAAKFFAEAVRAGGDYASSLAARAARIRAEAAAGAAPPIDDSARTLISQIGPAIVGGKKADLETRIVSGELVRFINASVGTSAWETRVLRTEQLNADLIEADVSITLTKLGKAGSGTALMLLARTPAGLKLAGIEFFEVQ